MNARAETYKHIQAVQRLLGRCVRNLLVRGEVHDASKLESPEVEIFEVATEKLAALTYGSDEYKSALAEMKPALAHHYSNNRHHPEYFDCWECPQCHRRYTKDDVPEIGYPQSDARWCLDCFGGEFPGFFELALLNPKGGIGGMTLLDLVEMLCDWKAATMRHNDGSILRSIEINQERFGYGDELKQILRNTVSEIESAEK